MHHIGIADELFIRGDIPMTKEEIRILTLVKARIVATDVVVDVGAGTGSLSIEAALLADQGHVFAVEKKAAGVSLIKQNAVKFGTTNLTVIEGEAPKALQALPTPNVVLIGGSGKNLPAILAWSDAKLPIGGRIIINCVTVETLALSLQLLAQLSHYSYSTVQVQVTRLNKIGSYHMSQALNPIHIITAVKGEV